MVKHMKQNIFLTILFSLFLFSGTLIAKTVHDIPYEYNGFFNYNHKNGKVIFMEFSSTVTKTEDSFQFIIYDLDLINSNVIRKTNIKKAAGCIQESPKIDSHGDWIASVNPKLKVVYLLNIRTEDCNKINYNFTVSNFGWSRDSKWLVFNERKDKSFHLLDPKTQEFSQVSNEKSGTKLFIWEPQLKTTLFAFLPWKTIGGEQKTSDMYEYFYLNNELQKVKYENKPPLYNKEHNLYFKLTSENYVEPYTTFYDLTTNKKIGVAQELYLRSRQTYVVMLNNNGVYFHGGRGLYDYKKNEFIHFSTPDQAVIPFAVDQDRYAIMYHSKENLLKVYDLQERKYIKSYTPFWREQK